MAHSNTPIKSDQNKLTVIRTDLAEAESYMLRMAQKAQHRYPHRFAGKSPCVFYRMRYVPPCENFRELKNLILRIQTAKGLRAKYRGIVALEVSEWLGYEQEEYFTILLKYMYDHRDHLHCAMILRDCPENRLRKFLSSIAAYITPRLMDGTVFTDRKKLEAHIEETFSEKEFQIRSETLSLLADSLSRPELKHARSLNLIQRTADEIIAVSGPSHDITADRVQRYLGSPSTTLTLLGVPMLTEERSNSHENLLL